MLGDYVHRINSIAFEAKDTTYTASYFDHYLKIDGSDRLRIKLYAKEFVMYIQEHSSSTCIWNISLSVDEVCQYLSFLSELLLRMSPIQGIKGYVQVIISNILQSPPGPLIYYACHWHSAVLQSSFMTCHGIFKKSNMTGAIGGYRTAYPSASPVFTPVFRGFRVVQSLLLWVVFCWSLSVLLIFFFWPFALYVLPVAASDHLFINV